MTLEELIREVPDLEEYVRYMPEELWQRYTIRVYPARDDHSPEGLYAYFFRTHRQRRAPRHQ